MFKKIKQIGRGSSRNSPPKITTQPQSVYDAVPGSTASLYVITDQKQCLAEHMQFQWQRCKTGSCSNAASKKDSWSDVESGEKDRITGIDSSTLLLTDVRHNDRGRYRCKVSNSTGVTLSIPVTLTVVVPPQIESHPSDAIDIVTGSATQFSVSVTCIDLPPTFIPRGEGGGGGGGGMNGGEEGGEGEREVRMRERVGSGGREDMHITWELRRANSLDSSAMDHHIEVNGEVPLPPETPHQRIFREHHPDLRHYLNTSAILPYLSRHSLVTSEQLEELTLPVLTNTRKVDLLLNWLPRSSVDFLDKFVVCLKEASDHLAHAELAEKLETTMRLRSSSQVSEMSVSTSPTTKTPVPLSPDSTGNGTTEVMGEWEVVREEEGKVEGVTTTVLWLLHVEKEQEGEYRCRVQYKGCTVYSQSASLTILSDEEIVRRLLAECNEVEEGTAVGKFLETHGNSSRLAKKALVAVLEQDSEQMSLLHAFTSRQVPVNFQHNGMYPLHYACMRGHWRTVQHLITCGASKTAITQQDGRNAVHIVAMRGDNNSLQFLIHTGVDQLVNVQDKYGKTPLHLVCEAALKITPSKFISQDMRDIKTVIQNLLKHDISIRIPDKSGQTPLHLAAKSGHPWIVEVFLLCDLSGLNDQDENGDTCLHIAAACNWGEVMISLLERGADETIFNKANMTPLSVAEVTDHTEIIDILQRKPGTIQRDRKKTVFVTNLTKGRPRSVNMDGEDQVGAMPAARPRRPLLKKKSSSEDKESRRSWSNLSPSTDTAVARALSPSGLLKIFHIPTPPSLHNSHSANNITTATTT